MFFKNTKQSLQEINQTQDSFFQMIDIDCCNLGERESLMNKYLTKIQPIDKGILNEYFIKCLDQIDIQLYDIINFKLVMIDKFNMKIKKSSVDDFFLQNKVDNQIMIFLIEYLSALMKSQKCLHYKFEVAIISQENSLTLINKPTLVDQIKYSNLIIFIDERWILGQFDEIQRHLIIHDFLNQQFSQVTKKDLVQLFINNFQQNQQDLISFSFSNYQIGAKTDQGLLIFSLLYTFWKRQQKRIFEFDIFKDKQFVKEGLDWLILKIMINQEFLHLNPGLMQRRSTDNQTKEVEDLLQDMNINNQSNIPLNKIGEQIQISKTDLLQTIQKINQQAELQAEETLYEQFSSDEDEYILQMLKLLGKGDIISDKQKIVLSKHELQFLLDQLQSKVEGEIKKEKQKILIQKEEAKKEMENFQNFQWMLQYYYQYQPQMYQKLLNEYNHRLHDKLLQNMGLISIFYKYLLILLQQYIIIDHRQYNKISHLQFIKIYH